MIALTNWIGPFHLSNKPVSFCTKRPLGFLKDQLNIASHGLKLISMLDVGLKLA